MSYRKLNRPFTSMIICKDASLWDDGVVYTDNKHAQYLELLNSRDLAKWKATKTCKTTIRRNGRNSKQINKLEGSALVLSLSWYLITK